MANRDNESKYTPVINGGGGAKEISELEQKKITETRRVLKKYK